MSHAARCLGSSLRSVASTHSSSSLGSARVLIPGTRTYGQAAVRTREPPLEHEGLKPRRSRESRIAGAHTVPLRSTAQDNFAVSESPAEDMADTLPHLTESQVPAHFAAYMNRLFSPLQFPPELAQRILTHGSHRLARRGHNAGLSFIGRRVLSAYLLLFLQSSRNLTSQHDIEAIAAHTLHTNLLGEQVGHAWGVGQVLIWQPAAPSSKLAGSKTKLEVLRSAGLYKVQGEAVQAMIGGIYQQFGASVAQRVFHTQLLPLLRVKGGLPKVFHNDAESISTRMGGEQGQLLPTEEERPKVAA
ncbi:hypothetical protein GALMADRAFT_252829 [Galerina marginata CBS 339.88]|uniref:RNase III domain-containing protein n=1 Tax=Galerina marginata (strain CBS 339.88) TaxID=685588 RepID=A0A067T0V6_GALM3|nr:hypothetical protein GALMADRAFT_252829 [Galerina marginata CBS 339.88]